MLIASRKIDTPCSGICGIWMKVETKMFKNWGPEKNNNHDISWKTYLNECVGLNVQLKTWLYFNSPR